MRSKTEESYRFVVHAAGAIDDETVNRLYDVGCDDATISYLEGNLWATFARRASTFEAAVATALDAFKTVPGLTVLEVTTDH